MKLSIKAVLALAAFVCLGGQTLFAQKSGYINSQELIAAMPERDSVLTKLEAISKEHSETLESLQVEFNNKLQDYQKNLATWSDALKQLREKELNDLQSRFQDYQQMADQDMQTQQQNLMAPVVDKAKASIAKVSKAAGLTVVYDISSGALAYYDEAAMVDILPLVKKEMGISATATTAPAAPAKK